MEKIREEVGALESVARCGGHDHNDEVMVMKEWVDSDDRGGWRGVVVVVEEEEGLMVERSEQRQGEHRQEKLEITECVDI